MRIAALVILGFAVAWPASASPQSDFDAVYGDWKKDLVITRCAYSQAQLQNAYDVARSNPDFQYETRFVDDTKAELDRVKAGACAGIAPLSQRKKSPLYGARIVSVRGKGGAASEVVAIRNRAAKTLSFRKASITNLKGRGFYFPNRFKLKKGRTVRVHTGCQRGKHRSTFTARHVWLCGKSGIFRDKGDLARLADAKLLVVSQRGFGSQRSRPAF